MYPRIQGVLTHWKSGFMTLGTRARAGAEAISHARSALFCRFKPESDHIFTRFTQKDTSKPLLSELKAWHRGLSRGVGLAPALEA
jgi:hypothetical protein